MKLTFLGTGAAFTVGAGNYQSNVVIESDSPKKLLLDCGSDIRLSLFEQGIAYSEITDIFISHLHADHIGGLECLALTSKYSPKGAYKHTLHISNHLIHDLWDRALSAGLNPLRDPSIQLSSFFEVAVIPHDSFQWEGVTFHLFSTLHFIGDFERKLSYGVWFKAEDVSVFFTSDTQFDLEGMQELYRTCDVIFHDCETAETKSGTHSHYTQLKLLPSEIKNKMWLYHYQPGPLPDAKKDGFKGFVKKGQCFDFKNSESWK